VQRRLLGRQLRQYREERGITVAEAAEFLGVRPPTLYRIEKGAQAILPRNVRLLCQLYRIGAPLLDNLLARAERCNEPGWWVSYSDSVPDWFAEYVGLESDAAEIWTYEAELIPGLLQTADYVRAVASAAQDADEGEVQRLVEFRKARQDRITAPDNPPALHAVLNEAVLRRIVGDPEVMRTQLHHLLDVAQYEHVTLQVLPFSAGAHAAMTGSFTMLRFPEGLEMDVVFLEHDHGGMYLERPADLERYSWVFRRLSEQALTPDASVKLIASLAQDL